MSTITECNELDNKKLMEILDKHIKLTIIIINDIIECINEEDANIISNITNIKEIQNDIITLKNRQKKIKLKLNILWNIL